MANRPWKGFMKANLNSKGNVMDNYDFNSDEVIKFQSISKNILTRCLTMKSKTKNNCSVNMNFFQITFLKKC